MDVRVYMTDGNMASVMNIKNVKAIDKPDGTHIIVVYGIDDDNKEPIAQFFAVLGYEIMGRK